jgi:hypothetical protein
MCVRISLKHSDTRCKYIHELGEEVSDDMIVFASKWYVTVRILAQRNLPFSYGM